MWCKVRMQLHSFACRPSIFLAPFIEKTVLSPLCGLGTSVKDHLTIYARVYFWSLCSVSLVYVSVFLPVPCCLDYSSFVMFWNQKVWGLQLCSSFSSSFWQFLVLVIHINFRIFFLSLQKKLNWNFGRNCIEFVDCFGYWGHFNNINSWESMNMGCLYIYLCHI